MTAAPMADWSPLEAELDRWQADGLTLPLWWRDDDAIAPTAALDQLVALSSETGLPVHLAVIPRDATPALADHLQSTPCLIPVVHGWAHENHAPADQKKAEFGPHRPTQAALDDAARGLDHLQKLCGDLGAPMFVPPWNRIDAEVVQGLAALGYRSLSTFTPRKNRWAADGLEQINTHLDPINWKGSRSLVDPDQLIAQVVRQLQDRRMGQADADEPYGILTHHLVHDTAIWDFTGALVHRLMAGPGRVWTQDKRTAR